MICQRSSPSVRDAVMRGGGGEVERAEGVAVFKPPLQHLLHRGDAEILDVVLQDDGAAAPFAAGDDVRRDGVGVCGLSRPAFRQDGSLSRG